LAGDGEGGRPATEDQDTVGYEGDLRKTRCRTHYRIGELYFEDVEQMQAGLGSEEGQAVTADFQNFATGGVTLLISEIDA
jgi:uncharacterized protein (TIGR02118 family)